MSDPSFNITPYFQGPPQPSEELYPKFNELSPETQRFLSLINELDPKSIITAFQHSSEVSQSSGQQPNRSIVQIDTSQCKENLTLEELEQKSLKQESYSKIKTVAKIALLVNSGIALDYILKNSHKILATSPEESLSLLKTFSFENPSKNNPNLLIREALKLINPRDLP